MRAQGGVCTGRCVHREVYRRYGVITHRGLVCDEGNIAVQLFDISTVFDVFQSR